MNKLKERKRISISDLKAVNKKLESFAFRVSHDLLSPVNALKMLVSLIEEETQEESTMEYIRMIKDRVVHLDQTIRNNLKNSKADYPELQITKIPLEKAVAEAAEIFSNEIKTLGIHFQVNIKEHEAFFSDRFRLNTVLENLIGNAVKYHNKDVIGKVIALEGYSDGNTLKISVSDNGIGIAEMNQERVFDKFFRESNSSEGYGIGLHIVKQTVEALEGTINVKSAQRKGSCFILELRNFKNQN